MVPGELHPPMTPTSPDLLAPLLRSRERFLRFLAPRLPSAADAEEVLQTALMRALERAPADALETEADVVSWFYRVLQNAAVDHHRRTNSGRAATDQLAAEWSETAAPTELRTTVCACMHDLLPTLKPEYAQIVSEVDLAERPVTEVAEQLGISSNNASVRLHRGRRALKEHLARTCGACAAHGCLDCSCRHRPKQ